MFTMCSSKKFILIIFNVLILSSQAKHWPPTKLDIEKVSIDIISSFAPTGLKPLIGFMLGIAADMMLRDVTKKKSNTEQDALEKLKIQIDNRFDSLSELVTEESQGIIESLIDYLDQQAIMDEGLERLRELKVNDERKFLDCVKKGNCEEGIRNHYIWDYVTKEQEELSTRLQRYFFRVDKKDGGKRIFDVMIQSYRLMDQRVDDSPCGREIQPKQKYIYDIYIYVVGVIIQHYEKIFHAHGLRYEKLKSANSNDTAASLLHMRDNYRYLKMDLTSITDAALSALKKVPRDYIRSCDPMQHIEGTTYDRLTHFIQPYIIPHVYAKSGPLIGDSQTYFDQRCYQPLSDDSIRWWSYSASRYECKTFRQLVNCNYLAYTVSEIYFKTKGYGLRYFKTEDGDNMKEYGKYREGLSRDFLNEYINRRAYHVPNPTGWETFLRMYKYDDIARKVQPFDICWLDSLNPNYSGAEKIDAKILSDVTNSPMRSPDFEDVNDNSVRKFSELPVQASSGKIVTGVRFRVLNKIIYIQIQEGKYINGSVDPGTLNWKELKECQKRVQELNIHRRTFNLDDVEIPLGSFLTGVQFIFNKDTVSLGVYGTKVNNSDNNPETHFYSPLLRLEKRREIVLDKPGPSENAPTDRRHKILSTPGENFVRFRPTDFEKNIETTVPYLDIQDVVDKEPKPLGGIGIEYRGKKGFGGFIGLKLISTDIISKIDLKEWMNEIDELANDTINKLSQS